MTEQMPLPEYLMSKRLHASVEAKKILSQVEFLPILNAGIKKKDRISLYTYRLLENGMRNASYPMEQNIRKSLG